MRWGLCVVPTFPFIHALTLDKETAESVGMAGQSSTDLWDWRHLTGDIIALVLHFVVWNLVIFLLELDFWKKFRNCSIRKMPARREDLDVDSDVETEEKRLERRESITMNQDEENDQGEAVRVQGFRKVYSKLCGAPFLAVENISFGIDYGECFALLGVNGAGKTTTFKSLTRDVIPSEGNLSIAGYDVGKQFGEARKKIGYCP